MEQDNAQTQKRSYSSLEVPKPDRIQIEAVFDLVMSRSNGCIEMRVIGNSHGSFVDQQTQIGFYDDKQSFVRDALRNHGRKQVYFGQNPRLPILLHAQPANRLQRGKGAKEKDVLVRNFFGIDIDTTRPSSKVAASDAEIVNARPIFEAIKSELDGKSIPYLIGYSGNGMHLNILTIPYPVNSNTTGKDCPFALLLRSLDRRFSSASASVDTGVYEANRVWKVYGTASVKGGNSFERPWRTARMEIQEHLPTPVDLLALYEQEISEQRRIENKKRGPSINRARAVSRRPRVDIVQLFKGASDV